MCGNAYDKVKWFSRKVRVFQCQYCIIGQYTDTLTFNLAHHSLTVTTDPFRLLIMMEMRYDGIDPKNTKLKTDGVQHTLV